MAGNRFERLEGISVDRQTSSVFSTTITYRDIDPVLNGGEVVGFTIEWEERYTVLVVPVTDRWQQSFDLFGQPTTGVLDNTETSNATETTTNGITISVDVFGTNTDNDELFLTAQIERPYREDSTDDLFVFQGTSADETYDGSSRNERVFLEAGNDFYFSADGGPPEDGGVDEVYGNAGNDTANLSNRDPASGEERFVGSFDGGSGTDQIQLPGSTTDYRIIEHGDKLVFHHQVYLEEHTLGRRLAVAENIERFDGVDLANLNLEDGFVLRAQGATAGPPEDLSDIRDFGGNDLGTPEGWKFIGTADAQYDGDGEHVYVNPEIGRWATAGPDENGTIDFGDHGEGGDTRVVGIYIDPLVQSGEVERGSDFDSQRRFQNDLEIDNLELQTAFDFDADGFQEMYFKTVDGTAYLRALMHADGNIQYANYQSEDQVRSYLDGLGYGAEVIDTILV